MMIIYKSLNRVIFKFSTLYYWQFVNKPTYFDILIMYHRNNFKKWNIIYLSHHPPLTVIHENRLVCTQSNTCYIHTCSRIPPI